MPKRKEEQMSSLENDGLEIMQVTPSPKKRSKKTNEVVIADVRGALRVTRELSLYKQPYSIVTMGRSDGANVLSIVPGGYIGHYFDSDYIRLLHRHLDIELRAWCERVLAFVQDIETDANDLFDKIRAKQIKDVVMKKILPLRKILQDKYINIVVHALSITGLKAYFQCNDKTAKFVYYLCAAQEFELKFNPDLEDRSYEIYTLFSHGKMWNFGDE